MSNDWEEILEDEYGLEADQMDEYQRELDAVEAEATGEEYLPDGMATIRLGGAEYHLFVANVYREDLPLLSHDAWTPEETQRLSRLISHLRTRRVVVRREGNVLERQAREQFLADLRVREQTCAELLRQNLQKGGAEEYL